MADEVVKRYKTVISAEMVGFDKVRDQASDIEKHFKKLAATSFSIGVNPKQTKQEISGIFKHLNNLHEASVKTEGKAKGTGLFMGSGGKARQNIARAMDDLKSGQKDVARIEAEMASAQDDSQKKRLKRELTARQEALKDITQKSGKSAKILKKQMAKEMKGLEEVAAFRDQSLKAHASEFGGALGDAVSSGLSGSLDGVFKGVHGMAAKAGAAFASAGARGQEKGGGAAALGKMSKGIGKMVGVIAKLALAVGAMTAVFAIIKQALDQTADMNKAILDMAGSWSIAADEAGKLEGGVTRMQSKLSEIRKQVMDVGENWSVGTTYQDQLEILALFEQQNFTLREMGQIIESNSGDFKRYTDFTKQAIHFAALLGIEHSEAVEAWQMWRRDLGLSMTEIRGLFGKIASDAVAARMNTKDFFATVMQVSTAMALYGARVNETSEYLEKLGKALGPRAAKEALQSLVNMWRDMSDEQRIQLVLIGGVAEVLGDLKSDARATFSGMKDELEAVFGGPISAKTATDVTDEQMTKILKENPDLYRRLNSAQSMEKDITEGKAAGAAEGMTKASTSTGMKAMDRVARNMFGGSIDELNGFQAQRFRQITGMDMNTFRELQLLNKTVELDRTETQKELQDALRNPALEGLEGALLNDDSERYLDIVADRMGKTKDALKKGLKDGSIQINQFDHMAALNEKQRKNLEANASKQADIATQHMNATRKVGSILTNVIANILNEISDTVMAIWRAISEFFGIDEKKNEVTKSAIADTEVSLAQVMKEKQGREDEYRVLLEKESSSGELSSEDSSRKKEIEDTIPMYQKQISGLQMRLSRLRGKDSSIIPTEEEVKDKIPTTTEELAMKTDKYSAADVYEAVREEGEKVKSMGLSSVDRPRPGAISARGQDTVTRVPLKREVGTWERVGTSLLSIAEAALMGHTSTSYLAPPTGISYGVNVNQLSPTAPGETQSTTYEAQIPNPEYTKALDAFDSKYDWLGPAAKDTLLTLQQLAYTFMTGDEASSMLTSLEGQLEELKISGATNEEILDFEREVLSPLSDQIAFGWGGKKFSDLLDMARVGQGQMQIKPNAAYEQMMKDATEDALKAQAKREAETELRAAGLDTIDIVKKTWNARVSGKSAEELFPDKSPEDQQRLYRALMAQSVNDAYFPQGGVANLAPGDYVIHESAFLKGGRGAMKPMAESRGPSGSGSGMNVSNTFYINGGDPQKVRATIIGVFKEIERRRMGTLPA